MSQLNQKTTFHVSFSHQLRRLDAYCPLGILVFAFYLSLTTTSAVMSTTLAHALTGRNCIITTALICFFTVTLSFHSILNDQTQYRPKANDIYPQALSNDFVLAGPADYAVKRVHYDCEGFPETTNILLVMKTGATEAFSKVPIHLTTTLQCAKNFLLFSDMEQNIAGHRVIDALDDVADSIKNRNGDFDLYRQLQEYRSVNGDPRDLVKNEGQNAWTLDKYKFLHMLVKAFKEKPDMPWYVFIEADTALIWTNLVQFLRGLDATEPHYIGSPSYLGDLEFGHGGSGFIVSGMTVRKLISMNPNIAAKYDDVMDQHCCGDGVFALALRDIDVKLSKAWPMMNGEKPISIPFNREHWCRPVITMHHLSAEETSQVWSLEQERKKKGIKVSNLQQRYPITLDYLPLTSIKDLLLFADLYHHYVAPHLTSPTRED